MNKANRLLTILSSFIATLFFTISCVNNLSSAEDASMEQIPISISPRIVLPTETRMSGTVFESDDLIGLFVLQQPTTLDNERHADNVRFTYATGGFVPEAPVYYPQGDVRCDFYSYYPYQEKGVEAGKTLMPVSVKSNQHLLANYQVSDFLVAKTLDVIPSKANVKLPYNHKMCRLDVEIDVKGEGSMTTILNSNPVVALKDLFTAGTYDFSKDTVTALTAMQDISLQGDWSIKGRKLVGKRAILIPQLVAGGTKILKLQIGEQKFSGTLSEELELGKGKVCTLTVSFDPTIGVEGFEPSITSWDMDGDKIEIAGVAEEEYSIALETLDFTQTGIYDIVQDGEVVAAVCQEYLKSPHVDNRAIVLYGVTGDAYRLTEGTVLQLGDASIQNHGGKVSWNMETNELTYTAGASSVLPRFYIAGDKSIAFTPPANPLPVYARKRMLTDVRGEVTNNYPLVKIGTQYWMQTDLHTQQYTDGSSIELLTSGSETGAGYRELNATYYYNQNAVSGGKLAPRGWEIPSAKAWDSLNTYMAGKTAALKKGVTWGNPDYPATNLTGFAAEAMGFYSISKNGSIASFNFAGKYNGYWKQGTDAVSIVLLNVDSNELHHLEPTLFHSVPVRCVRKSE